MKCIINNINNEESKRFHQLNRHNRQNHELVRTGLNGKCQILMTKCRLPCVFKNEDIQRIRRQKRFYSILMCVHVSYLT